MRRRRRSHGERRRGRRRAARARSLPAHHPRGTRRRRARLAAGDAPPARPARQGLGDVPGSEGVPAADRVPLPAAGGGLPRAAGRHGRPHDRLPRLRQRRPHAGRVPHRGRRLQDQHRPPPRQHALRRRQPRRHRTPRAPPRSSTSWRSRWAPRSRREIASALYVGLVTDTGSFMYENTDAAHAPDGRRADRGRGRRRRHLPATVRARPDREAAPASRGRWRASSGSTSGSPSPTSPPATTRRPGPARR